MNLFLLRHGIAEELGPRNQHRDADRALTREGRDKLRDVATAMESLALSFDLILSSPYKRAHETAEIVARHLKLAKAVELSVTLAPGGSTRKLLGFLQDRQPAAEQVLLVGHEPYLSELIALLVFGEVGPLVVMKKGGLCKLSVKWLRHGQCAALEWLLTPRQMQLMA